MADDSSAKTFEAETYCRHFNHLSPDYGEHFAKIYAHMRQHCPVAHSDQLGGFWVATRYRDIMRIARDDDTFSSLYGITITGPVDEPGAANPIGPINTRSSGPLASLPPGPNGELPRLATIPIDLDPPFHQPYRRAVDPLFTPKAVEGQRPWIEHWVTRLINDLIEMGRGDFSRDLGTPLTSIYTMKAAGLPIEDWSDYAHVVQFGIAGSSSVAPRTRGVDMLHLRQRVAEEIQVQRQRPLQEGLISHLVTTAVEDRKLDDWEIEAYVWLLIFGGVDTTQACMGSAFVWLARNPERRQWLADHPDLMTDAVEEFLRVFAPQQALSRTVMKDFQLGGQTLKRGDRVLMCWASANLDEEQFERADEVDFVRENKRHMAFGMGIHRCLGSNVARLEFRLLFEQILERLPDFEIDEKRLRHSPVSGVVHGYESVPFTFTPGSKRPLGQAI